VRESAGVFVWGDDARGAQQPEVNSTHLDDLEDERREHVDEPILQEQLDGVRHDTEHSDLHELLHGDRRRLAGQRADDLRRVVRVRELLVVGQGQEGQHPHVGVHREHDQVRVDEEARAWRMSVARVRERESRVAPQGGRDQHPPE